MAFYGPNGEKVTGRKMSGGGDIEAFWEIDITAAVGRCERGASAKDELATLFKKYPQLKEDLWKTYEHPLSPVLDWFVKQKLGCTDSESPMFYLSKEVPPLPPSDREKNKTVKKEIGRPDTRQDTSPVQSRKNRDAPTIRVKATHTRKGGDGIANRLHQAATGAPTAAPGT